MLLSGQSCWRHVSDLLPAGAALVTPLLVSTSWLMCTSFCLVFHVVNCHIHFLQFNMKRKDDGGVLERHAGSGSSDATLLRQARRTVHI